MKINSKQRHLILAGLVVALAGSVMANWYFSGPERDSVAVENMSDVNDVNNVNLGDAIYVNITDISDEYFAKAKLSRDESYDNAVATLKELIDSTDVDIQSAETAASSINSMTQQRIAQVNIENLVKAKTGSECVAVLTEEYAEIIVSQDVLSSDTVLQIKEIVIENAKISSEKISIIGAK